MQNYTNTWKQVAEIHLLYYFHIVVCLKTATKKISLTNLDNTLCFFVCHLCHAHKINVSMVNELNRGEHFSVYVLYHRVGKLFLHLNQTMEDK